MSLFLCNDKYYFYLSSSFSLLSSSKSFKYASQVRIYPSTIENGSLLFREWNIGELLLIKNNILIIKITNFIISHNGFLEFDL